MKVLGATAALVILSLGTACSAPTPPLGEDPREPNELTSPSAEVDGPQTVLMEYSGVEVKVPSTWERLDTSACEFGFDRWGPPESDPCNYVEGVAFYGSALFDPATGPGVNRTKENGTPGWGGYVLRGDWAVYGFSWDRGVVRGILDSAVKADSGAGSGDTR